MQSKFQEQESSLTPHFLHTIGANWEILAFMVIMAAAVFTRLYELGIRVMSHDETSHVYFSWLLYTGQGYRHDPVTHGPLQFHLLALAYYLFGDTDFAARLPQALFSIVSVGFMWSFRRYLGRAGALIGALLMLVSPYILYYGRYARNEAFVALFGVICLWSTLRYLETGRDRYLYIFIVGMSFHFATKETAFIYAAQFLIFFALWLLVRLTQKPWEGKEDRRLFIFAFIISAILLAGAMGVNRWGSTLPAPTGTETIAPAVPGQTANPLEQTSTAPFKMVALILGGLGAASLLSAVFFAVRGFTWKRLTEERSFHLAIALGTMVLPMLAPFPVKLLGINPIDYNSNLSITITGIFAAVLAGTGVAIGLLWDKRRWLISAGLFYAIFVVLYTTFFTNGFGLITGIVGSLGYWLEQQGVNRGSQPWYYYGLIQIPFYEFLPLIGSFLAAWLGFRWWRKNDSSQSPFERADTVSESNQDPKLSERYSASGAHTVPVILLFGFWSITSLIAYSIAGEKMPWLTVHITLGMILLTGWGLGRLVELVDWKTVLERHGVLYLLTSLVFLASFLGVSSSVLGITPPFQGKTLEQLQATSTFLFSLIALISSGWGLVRLSKNWPSGQSGRLLTLGIFVILVTLTARSSWMASFINYDKATELLVYAHMGPGPKEALGQIEEISQRTTNGLGISIAYDNEMTYPYWWYLRNYPNKRFFDKNPTRDLRDSPVIVVGNANYASLEPVVGQGYDYYEYVRIWWPNQSYFGLTWQRIFDAITDSQMRRAILNIWLYRDYTLYGQLIQQDMSMQNWDPAQKFRLYIRKDIVSQMWNYGVGPSAAETVIDPYEGKGITLGADRLIGSPGAEPGQFNKPRGIALAPDGTLYVADTDNSRIQHLTPEGEVLHVWGSFADAAAGNAPGGTFNQPWGIAVATDGSVLVADTWNHRIQKFSPEGNFLQMWGYFGQAEQPDGFWGPRDVAIDAENRVFVTDTGNKRVAVFDLNGNFITQFGSVGLQLGQFDEPVGLALGPDGLVYVADTWNQRIQVFARVEDGSYTPLNTWDVVAWFGQSLDNKPYMTVDSVGHIFATDPLGYRVLEWDANGQFVRYFGEQGTDTSQFGLVGAVTADKAGGIWVSDAGNSRLMHFTLP